jgi:dihydroorotase
MRRGREFGVRTKALLHVSAVGLVGRTGESRDLSMLDVDAAAAAIAGAGDFIVGIIVRMDPKAVGGSGIRPLAMAVEVAAGAGLPVMAHVGRDDFLITEVLSMLRPGDIMTHGAGGAIAGIRERGPARDAVAAAYERGVILDVGHGSGGFRFDVMEDLIALGMPPHVISSDLHTLSMYGPAFDLPTVMTKLLAVGLSVEDVFAAVTIAPARALGLAGGRLDEGDPADLALWRCVTEPTQLADVAGSLRTSPVRLTNVGTWVGGRQLPPMPLADPPSWVEVSAAQQRALARRRESARSLAVQNLVGPADIFNQIITPAAPAV